MIPTDDIFRLKAGDGAAFEKAALELFRFQAAACPPYREYLALVGIRPEHVTTLRGIPFLPIELFKSHEVYCGDRAPEAVFTSSATTGMVPSRHMMRSLALYEQAFRGAFRTFYGDPARWSLYALLPNYLRRKGSSLVYMADRLIADIWNQVEKTYEAVTPNERRLALCREYGLIYYYRPNEKKRANTDKQ